MRPSDFSRQLLRRWSSARIHPISNPESPYAFDWEIDGDRLRGSYGRDGETLVMVGEERAVAEMALWYRGLIAPEHPLLLFDDINSISVELQHHMSVQEVVDAIESFLG